MRQVQLNRHGCMLIRASDPPPPPVPPALLEHCHHNPPPPPSLPPSLAPSRGEHPADNIRWVGPAAPSHLLGSQRLVVPQRCQTCPPPCAAAGDHVRGPALVFLAPARAMDRAEHPPWHHRFLPRPRGGTQQLPDTSRMSVGSTPAANAARNPATPTGPLQNGKGAAGGAAGPPPPRRARP